jgi:NAD(P)-dependent dehydrogenase (short-subunit alcohol dehydrogenase family)
MKRLENKVAIVTGGGNGIGLATGRLYAQEGAKVVLLDQNKAALETALKEIDLPGVSFYVADVTDPEQVQAATQFTLDTHGKIDIAVLNAGIAGVNQPLEEFPTEVFDSVLAVNVRAVWLALKSVIPGMKSQLSGSIIITSSVQGLSALPGTTAYTTSKHALVGMMKGAALELAEFGVRVNAIHPGFVETPMMDRIHREVVPDAPEVFQQALSKSVPMGRYARAEEIARLLLFLGSDESSYSTGSSFTADGGMLASLPTA